MDLLTIIASDNHTSDTMGRTFSTKSVEGFKKAIEEFEKVLPFSRYELMCEEFVDDYSDEIIAVLDDLSITH